jgi:carboxypeptidase family protein
VQPLRNVWMLRASSVLLATLALSCSGTSTPRGHVLVAGVVRMPDGSPYAGGIVGFFRAPVEFPAPRLLAPAPRSVIYENPPIAITNTQGQYSIHLQSGTYEVWVGGAADSGAISQHVTSVTLRTPSLGLDLLYAAYRVSGRMIGHGGTVVTSGHIWVNGMSPARADIRNGSYTCLLPAGTYEIWANPGITYEGFPRVRFDVAVASDTTMDLSVDGNELTGTVTGPDGAPLVGGYVAAVAATASAYSETASDGTYRIYLPTRTYTFEVSPPNGEVWPVRTYPNILIDSPRTLDFDLSVPPPTPAQANASGGRNGSGTLTGWPSTRP